MDSLAVDYRAKQFVTDRDMSSMAFEVKGTRAIWDETLALPGTNRQGGWRCPVGTRFGGQITDRFGRNCGWGAARRLANEIVDLGQRYEAHNDKRRGRRLARREENTRRNIGQQAGVIERGAGRIARALESSPNREASPAPVRRVRAVEPAPRRRPKLRPSEAARMEAEIIRPGGGATNVGRRAEPVPAAPRPAAPRAPRARQGEARPRRGNLRPSEAARAEAEIVRPGGGATDVGRGGAQPAPARPRRPRAPRAAQAEASRQVAAEKPKVRAEKPKVVVEKPKAPAVKPARVGAEKPNDVMINRRIMDVNIDEARRALNENDFLDHNQIQDIIRPHVAGDLVAIQRDAEKERLDRMVKQGRNEANALVASEDNIANLKAIAESRRQQHRVDMQAQLVQMRMAKKEDNEANFQIWRDRFVASNHRLAHAQGFLDEINRVADARAVPAKAPNRTITRNDIAGNLGEVERDGMRLRRNLQENPNFKLGEKPIDSQLNNLLNNPSNIRQDDLIAIEKLVRVQRENLNQSPDERMRNERVIRIHRVLMADMDRRGLAHGGEPRVPEVEIGKGGKTAKISVSEKAAKDIKKRINGEYAKRNKILGEYLDKRYGEGKAPWKDMTPKRITELRDLADRGDADAKKALTDWAKAMYGHEAIEGLNGKTYRTVIDSVTYGRGGQISLSIRIEVKGANGSWSTAGSSGRTLNFSGDQSRWNVYNNTMFLRGAENKGAGIQTIYNQHAFMYAKAAGFKKVGVSAIDDGPYVWGKVGFHENGNVRLGQVQMMNAELLAFKRGAPSIINTQQDANIIEHLIDKHRANPSSVKHQDFIYAVMTPKAGQSDKARGKEMRDWFISNMPFSSGVYDLSGFEIMVDPRKKKKA